MVSRDPERPNVVVVLTDDQGYWALGDEGGDAITPNLGRLAQEGTRSDNFFCTSPVCSPARASLLTGTIPSQHGVHDFIHEPPTGTDGVDFLRGEETYVDVLARNGYACGIVGKWHLGQSQLARNGFTKWSVLPGGASPYFDAEIIRDGRVEPVDGYLTDALTDEALDFIDRHGDHDGPFYLSLHYTAPHAPWVDAHPDELTDLYRDCGFDSIPEVPRHPWSRQFHDVMRHAERHPRANLIGYFAAVTGLDRGVGRLLDHLRARAISDSTMIVFLSDNGFNAGHHGIWGKGNGTFPMNLYDTSVKVPCIWRQPGRIPAGALDSGLRSGYDFMPTLLGYLALGSPYRGDGPGRDFSSMLMGDTADDREFVVVHAEYGPARMIRTSEWKFVDREPYGPRELYCLRDDPGETVNLSGDPTRRATEHDLWVALRDWFREHVDARRDGARLSVTGAGQHNVVDHDVPGPPVFEPHPEVTFPW